MNDAPLAPRKPESKDIVQQALARTPARVLTGRCGPGYRTATWLKLREDHAAARDAVRATLDVQAAFGLERIARFGLFETCTQAASLSEHLLRPDRGRQFDRASRQIIAANCPANAVLQVVIGDGLSASAMVAQAPPLLDRVAELAAERAWSFGRPFVVRHCRVGIMNEVGDILNPQVVVLLIGERPGLATAESLSAYMAYRPRLGHTDANRNLISNIHAKGVSIENAAQRIMALAASFRAASRSGVEIKESQAATFPVPSPLVGEG